jgi:hypothetical protein
MYGLVCAIDEDGVGRVCWRRVRAGHLGSRHVIAVEVVRSRMSRSLRAVVVVLIAAVVAVVVSLVGGALGDFNAPAPARSVQGSAAPVPSAQDETASERTASAPSRAPPSVAHRAALVKWRAV